MINYLRESFRRKKARRFTKEYSANIISYYLEREGKVDFAVWNNPIARTVNFRQETIDFFKKIIQMGGLSIDIGANVGDTTVPIALATGKSGLTLGFDPNPYAYKILLKNASLNKEKTNIVTYPYAISVKEEEFYFISSEASFGNGGISLIKESRHGKFIYPDKIKGVNLLDFLEMNYSDWLKKLSFIKIDTEGYDLEIVKSISGLISKYKPVIITESFGKNSDEGKMELYEVIEKHGYEIYCVKDFDIHAELIKLKNKQQMTDWKETIDICSIPSGMSIMEKFENVKM